MQLFTSCGFSGLSRRILGPPPQQPPELKCRGGLQPVPASAASVFACGGRRSEGSAFAFHVTLARPSARMVTSRMIVCSFLLFFRKSHARCWSQLWYNRVMSAARKITVEVPQDLLKKAQRASGKGITQTVRTGLQLLAASRAYDRLLQAQGEVRFSRSWQNLKDDR
jgi:hypothetical protein